MLSVSVAACFAGQCLFCSPPPFSPAAIRRFEVCQLTKQASTDVLAMAFRSPVTISGLPVTAAGSMLPASRFACPVRFLSDSFGFSLQASFVSEEKPFDAKTRRQTYSERLLPLPLPSLPPWDFHPSGSTLRLRQAVASQRVRPTKDLQKSLPY